MEPKTPKTPKTPVHHESVSSTSTNISEPEIPCTKVLNSNKPPKTKKVKAKVLYFWNSADVNKWLKKHCRQYHQLYGDLFQEHDISGRALIRLNDYKLEEIGIADRHHREDILRNILRLKLKTEYQELKTLDQRVGVTFDRK